MEFRCNHCNRNFKEKKALEQHNNAKHNKTNLESIEKKKSVFKKYFIFISIFLIILFFGLGIKNMMSKPGKYNEFAKCLTEKGVVMYGNDYCSYTIKQLNFFGKSKQHLNYIKCTENEKLCDEKNIKTTPTWEIGEAMYPQVQDFEMLSSVTGCEI